jgi:hypothetical protein
MNRFSRLAALALLPCLMFAQENKKAEPPRPANMVTRMIRLQHANPQQVRDLLIGTGTRAQWDDVLRVVVVSGSPSEVASVEQTVKELDSEMAKVTVSNAELTVYVLGASQENSGASHIPASLEKTFDQIKSTFPYQSYRLLETVVARSRIGEQTQISGTLEPFKDNPEIRDPATYKLRFRLAGITSGSGRDLFHIQGFWFDAGFPVRTATISPGDNGKQPHVTTQWQRTAASIQTDFDVSSNQQVVIGKAGVAGNSAVFLIVEAKAVK